LPSAPPPDSDPQILSSFVTEVLGVVDQGSAEPEASRPAPRTRHRPAIALSDVPIEILSLLGVRGAEVSHASLCFPSRSLSFQLRQRRVDIVLPLFVNLFLLRSLLA
jgi:hypothetical protein